MMWYRCPSTAGVAPQYISPTKTATLTGNGLDALMPAVLDAYVKWNKRASTGRVNRLLTKLSARLVGTGNSNEVGRIKYLTQVGRIDRVAIDSASMSGGLPLGLYIVAVNVICHLVSNI